MVPVRKVASGLLILVVVLACALVLKREEEFNGKPVRQWVHSLGTNATEDAIQAWVSCGTNGIPLLVDAMAKKGPPTERIYAWLYGRLPSSISSKLPVPFPRKVIRFNAANVLADFGPDAAAAVPALIAMLSDPDVKANASKALGDIGPTARSAVPHLVKALSDPAIQNNCFAALSKVGIESMEAIAEVINLLGSGSDEVKLGALATLGSVTSTNSDVDLALERALRTGSKLIRIKAILAAGRRGPAGAAAIPAILELVSDKNDRATEFEYQAIRTFGQFGSAGVAALPWLNGKMGESRGFVRLAAAESIWSIEPGNADAANALRSCLRSDNIDVRRVSAKSLLEKMLKIDDAQNLLIGLQSDEDEFLRVVGCIAGWMKDTNRPPPIEPLLTFLEKPPRREGGVVYVSNHSMAFDLFKHFGSRAQGAVPRLLVLRRSDKEFIRRKAAETLRVVQNEQ